MAELFIAQLPRVAKEELSEDTMCIVCHYSMAPSDSESAEEAVGLTVRVARTFHACLPCTHPFFYAYSRRADA